MQYKLHPRESKIQQTTKKQNDQTNSLLILLSRVIHHLHKIPVPSANTPTTDQLEPAPELSYQAVWVVIWHIGMSLLSAHLLPFALSSESVTVPKKHEAAKLYYNYLKFFMSLMKGMFCSIFKTPLIYLLLFQMYTNNYLVHHFNNN